MFLLSGAEARQCGHGVHYAVPAGWVDADRLDRASSDELREFIDFLDGRFTELLAGRWALPTDKVWHLVHRGLTDGSLDGGFSAAHLCVLGATDAYWVERDDGGVEWIVNLLAPTDVREAAGFTGGIDEAEFRRRYGAIDAAACDYEPWPDDLEFASEAFLFLREFLGRAAEAGRWVVFVAGGP